MELLFDAYADQLERILVALKRMKNAKVEQAGPVDLCNPTILWESLKPSMGNEAFPTPWLWVYGIMMLYNAREIAHMLLQP